MMEQVTGNQNMLIENAIFEICHLQKLTICWFVWHEIWPHLQGDQSVHGDDCWLISSDEYERPKDCGVICPVSGRVLSSPWSSLSSSSLTSSPSPSSPLSPSPRATYCDAIREKAIEVRLRDDEAVFACGRFSLTGSKMLNCWWYLLLSKLMCCSHFNDVTLAGEDTITNSVQDDDVTLIII